MLQSFLDFRKEDVVSSFFFRISLVVAIFILLTDSKFSTATADLSYLFGIGLILATFVVGKEVGGSESWIPLGFMNLQPVELCKIFTSLAIAKYLSNPDTDFRTKSQELVGAAIAFAPAILSVAQKTDYRVLFICNCFFQGKGYQRNTCNCVVTRYFDYRHVVAPNTLFIILTVLAAILPSYFAYMRLKRSRGTILSIILIWLLSVGVRRFLVPTLFEKILKPHQVVGYSLHLHIKRYQFKSEERAKQIDKEYAKLGSKSKNKGEKLESYNVKQSKIAIGSGGFWGKGFLQGTQTSGDFVPTENADFYFFIRW